MSETTGNYWLLVKNMFPEWVRVVAGSHEHESGSIEAYGDAPKTSMQ